MHTIAMKYSQKIPHGIMFHHFHGGKHLPSQGSISEKDFQSILEFIRPERILAPEEWMQKLELGKLALEDLCLTFDDSLLSQLEIALPVLEKYNLKAFWFIYSGVFEGYPVKFEIYRKFRCQYFQDVEDFYKIFFQKIDNSKFKIPALEAVQNFVIQAYLKIFPFYTINDVKFRRIRDSVLRPEEYEEIMDKIMEEQGVDAKALEENLWMKNVHLKYLSEHGHSVGLHSYSHPMVLASLPVFEQKEEYEKNFNHILKTCLVRPKAVAHPANSYSNGTIEILKSFGISCGFRSNMSPRRLGEKLNPTPFEIAREDSANIIRLINNHHTHETQ